MQAVNQEMNPREIAETMKTFVMENEKAGIQMEMTSDAFQMIEDPASEP